MRIRLAAAGLMLFAALAHGQGPKSGLDLDNFDKSVRPQDDLFRHANGGWIARASIPPERVMHGLFTELADKADRDLHELIKTVSAAPDRTPGSPSVRGSGAGRWGPASERARRGAGVPAEEKQIADLYASLMNEARIEALGAGPIEAELQRIDAMATPADFAYRTGHLAAIATGGPFGGRASMDPTAPGGIIVTITQGGTLLPDSDYYLNPDPKYADVRKKYVAYLVRIFSLTGRKDPTTDARAVLELETALARIQVPQAEAASGDRRPARYSLRALMRDMPGFHWIDWARAQGIDAGSDVILEQPAFFNRFASLVPATPMTTWRAWLAARHITAAAPFLSSPFAQARFDFFGRTLSGQVNPIAQWKRAVSLVNGYLGDALGKLYVERHFSPDAKRRVEALVDAMLEATRDAIREAAWMTPATRHAALEKLRGAVTKVGYPDNWRDYSGLVIKADDLVGNIERAQRLDNAYRIARLRRPHRAAEWLMPPQTVNAYYSPGLNEIVVPAAMLQPPMFQMDADDAVNFGGIGAVIGHELGHGFDERGRHFDGTGAVRDWWTSADARAFEHQRVRLVEHYNGFRSIDGMRVNGTLTLDENIGDLGGLALAYRAYTLSRKGKPAPVIDGFSGDQRFFLGWARAWRSIMRDEYRRQWLLWIPHAPPEFRANGPLSHIDAFYAAFNVKPGDKLYVAPEKRVRIW